MCRSGPSGLNGGRGRNRTFNLSIKSRMLCQLSYASIIWETAERQSVRLGGHDFECPLEKYSTGILELKRKRETTFEASLGLRKVECAAIAGDEGAVPLSQKISYIYQCLNPLGKNVMIADRLTHKETQIGGG